MIIHLPKNVQEENSHEAFTVLGICICLALFIPQIIGWSWRRGEAQQIRLAWREREKRRREMRNGLDSGDCKDNSLGENEDSNQDSDSDSKDSDPTSQQCFAEQSRRRLRKSIKGYKCWVKKIELEEAQKANPEANGFFHQLIKDFAVGVKENYWILGIWANFRFFGHSADSSAKRIEFDFEDDGPPRSPWIKDETYGFVPTEADAIRKAWRQRQLCRREKDELEVEVIRTKDDLEFITHDTTADLEITDETPVQRYNAEYDQIWAKTSKDTYIQKLIKSYEALVKKIEREEAQKAKENPECLPPSVCDIVTKAEINFVKKTLVVSYGDKVIHFNLVAVP